MKSKIRSLSAAVGLLLSVCILSSCAGPAGDAAYISPASDEGQTDQGHLLEGKFNYRLPDGKQSFAVSLETWESGKLIETTPVCSLTGTGGLELSADFSGDRSELVWFANESYAEIPLKDEALAWFYTVMTDEEFRQNFDEKSFDYESGIVLACVGFSPIDEGLDSISCTLIMKDSEYLNRYDCAQVLRVSLTK